MWNHVAFENDFDLGFATGAADAQLGEPADHKRPRGQYAKHQDVKHCPQSDYVRGYVAGYESAEQ